MGNAVHTCKGLYRTTDRNFYVYKWYFKYIVRDTLNMIIHVSISLFNIKTHIWFRLSVTVDILYLIS